jgi:hypothetical protein
MPAAPQHGVLVIQTDPRAGREAEFEQFYNGIHVPEILQTPGFTVGRRFRAVQSDALPQRPEGEWRSNLAIYDVVSDDLVAAYTRLLGRMTGGDLTSTDVFSDVNPYRAQLFEQVFEARQP